MGRRYGGALSDAQRQALRELAACRTAVLGGPVEHGLDGGSQRIAYHACRNRHGPKCQALARARWLDQPAQHLLPVAYQQVVFTPPAELSELVLAHPAALSDLLLGGAAAALREVAANPKRLGAALGAWRVLHSWGQHRHHHPPVHGVVTGGGLSCEGTGTTDTTPRRVACRPGLFLPVRVLRRVFRGQFLAGLRAALDQGPLALPTRLAALTDARARSGWCATWYAKDWVVYAQRPFGGPAQVLKYPARYTHRVALSNARPLALSDGRVTFRYQDYAEAHRHQTRTLEADELLRRFVQHVLPRSFVRIRHYGLWAHHQREDRLAACRRLWRVAKATAALPGTEAGSIEPAQPRCCPQCGGSRLVYRALQPAELVSAAPAQDSS